jgi:hypothetical protein
MRLLIAHGVDINARTRAEGPLRLQAKLGRSDAMPYDAGATPYSIATDGKSRNPANAEVRSLLAAAGAHV